MVKRVIIDITEEEYLRAQKIIDNYEKNRFDHRKPPRKDRKTRAVKPWLSLRVVSFYQAKEEDEESLHSSDSIPDEIMDKLVQSMLGIKEPELPDVPKLPKVTLFANPKFDPKRPKAKILPLINPIIEHPKETSD